MYFGPLAMSPYAGRAAKDMPDYLEDCDYGERAEP